LTRSAVSDDSSLNLVLAGMTSAELAAQLKPDFHCAVFYGWFSDCTAQGVDPTEVGPEMLGDAWRDFGFAWGYPTPVGYALASVDSSEPLGPNGERGGIVTFE
jgi:hypothetical protein